MLSAENLWEYCRTCLIKIGETNVKENCKSVSIKKFPDLRNLIHVCLSKSSVDAESMINYAPFICRSCFDKWSEFSKLYQIAVKTDEKIRNVLEKDILKQKAIFGENKCKNEYLLNMEKSIDEQNIETFETNYALLTNNQITNINDKYKVNQTQPDDQKYSESQELVVQPDEGSSCSFSDKMNECFFSAEFKKRDDNMKKVRNTKNVGNPYTFKTCKTKSARLKSSDQNVFPIQDKLKCDYGDNATKKVRFQCKECNKYFWKRNKYDGHMKQVHEGIRRPYKCHQCDKSYNLYKTLLQHKRECHSEKSQEVFKCDKCDKIFKTGIILKQHLNNKHSERKESMRSICDQCGFIAAHQYSLTRHIINKHTETDQIKCDQCPKVFKTRYSLKYHIIGNHNLSNIKPFKCPECHMEFVRKTLLNQHKQTHLKYTERMKCDFEGCKVRFVKRGDKTHHMRLVHLKIKQHICDFCGESFGAMQTLRHHRFIHTGEKPYKCSICGQGFRQRTAMKTHRKTHFGKELEEHNLINNLPETNLSLLNKIIS